MTAAHEAILARTTSENNLNESPKKDKGSYSRVLEKASSTRILPTQKNTPQAEPVAPAETKSSKKPAKPVYDSSTLAAIAGQFANNSAGLMNSNPAPISPDVVSSTKTSSLASRLSKKS